MRNLLSNHDLRHLEILEYLETKDWVTISQLVSHLGFSEKSIRNDIKEINGYLDAISIETSTKRGIKLSIPHNYSNAHIYSAILHKSSEFQIIECVFFNEDYTLNTLSEKLFISPSTIKRIIKRINAEIQKENFEISIQTLKLTGDELGITRFMFFYFEEKYIEGQYPFNQTQLDIIHQMIRFLTASEEDTWNFPNFSRLSVWVMIHIIRVRNGNTIPHKSGYTHPFSSKFKRLFHAHFQLSLNDELLYQLFSAFINGLYLRNEEQLQIHLEQNPIQKKNYKQVKKILSHLTHRLDVPIQNEGIVLLSMLNTLSIPKGKTYILYNRSQFFFDRLFSKNSEFADILKTEIEKQFKDDSWEEDQTYLMLFNLVTHWKGLLTNLKKTNPKLSVGLFFTIEVEHTELLKSQLEFFFDSRLDVTIMKDLSLPSFKKNAQQYQLILTNIVGISLPDVPVLTFDLYPTADTWKSIERIYDEFIQKRHYY